MPAAGRFTEPPTPKATVKAPQRIAGLSFFWRSQRREQRERPGFDSMLTALTPVGRCPRPVDPAQHQPVGALFRRRSSRRIAQTDSEAERERMPGPGTLSGKYRCSMEIPMAEGRTSNPDFSRAFGEAQKNAASVAGDAVDAAQDVYDSASKAARKTAGSFERALKNTIETQPYTAVAIALGIGWLLGRMHRPL
jgi:hypothetical protein